MKWYWPDGWDNRIIAYGGLFTAVGLTIWQVTT